MKKVFLFTVLTLGTWFLSSCGDKTPAPLEFTPTTSVSSLGLRMPAEWEPQQHMWMGWWAFNYGGEETPTESLMLEMITALSGRVKIKLIVQDAVQEASVRAFLESQHINLENIRFYQRPHNDFWLRDMGPVYLVNSSQQKAVVDFGFDYWSYGNGIYGVEDPADDEALDRAMAAADQIPSFRCNLVSEGGNIDVNGRGTALMTKSVVLRRNRGKTLEQIEQEYKRCYGFSKIIWLEKGVVEDDGIYQGAMAGGGFNPGGTGGHIDDYVRFAPNNTILLAEVPSEELTSSDSRIRARALENKRRLDQNYDILQHSTDESGNAFTIVRIPTAPSFGYELHEGDPFYDYYLDPSHFDDGHAATSGDVLNIVATTSYLNFVITNGAVLVPVYWKEGLPPAIRTRDQEVLEKIGRAYPERTIIQLHQVLGANYGAGGPHCMTQQEP